MYQDACANCTLRAHSLAIKMGFFAFFDGLEMAALCELGPVGQGLCAVATIAIGQRRFRLFESQAA